MTTKLSNGAVQLLDVITKMPGHFREDYCKVADISRSMWNKLSGELRRTGYAHTVRTTTTRNGKEVTDFQWFPGEANKESRIRKTSKTPPAVRRGNVRANTRPATKPATRPTTQPKTSTKRKTRRISSKSATTWTKEDLDQLHSLWKEGLTDKEIEAKMGRTAWAIRGKRKTMRWVADRGKKNPHKENKPKKKPSKKPKTVKPEPLYEVTIVEEPQQEQFVEEIAERVGLIQSLTGLEDAIVRLINNEVNRVYQNGIISRLNDIEKRLTTLEDSLNENSKADQATINVIGELEKTLAALKGNL
jgi:hypothetical protein